MARTPRWQPPLNTDDEPRVEYLPGQARRRPAPLSGSRPDEEPLQTRRSHWTPPDQREPEPLSLFAPPAPPDTFVHPTPPPPAGLDLRARWLGLLREAGCEAGQGYRYGRPMPMKALLETWPAKA